MKRPRRAVDLSTIIGLTAFFICSPLAFATNSAAILNAAQNSCGKKMWFGYGLSRGTLGCAAALSNVLKKGGITSAHSPLVTALRTQLLKGTQETHEYILRDGEGTKIDDTKLRTLARPGDVVLAFVKPPTHDNGGPNAHCGIMGPSTTIFTNDWNDGIWKQVDIHLMFDFYPYVRLVRVEATDK